MVRCIWISNATDITSLGNIWIIVLKTTPTPTTKPTTQAKNVWIKIQMRLKNYRKERSMNKVRATFLNHRGYYFIRNKLAISLITHTSLTRYITFLTETLMLNTNGGSIEFQMKVILKRYQYQCFTIWSW